MNRFGITAAQALLPRDMNHPKMPGWSLGFATVLYLGLPLLIFFFGWLKPVHAIFATVAVLYSGWQLIRAWPPEPAVFSRKEILLVAVFSLAITAFAGIGGFTPQAFDWAYHNAVLMDCIRLPWPVVIPDGAHHWILDYYLGYYLPAAVVGKIDGYAAAQVAWWVWSSLGVMLSSFWFARLTGLSARIAAPAFFAFAGLVFIANLLVQLFGLADNYHGWVGFYPNEFWARIWQFPSDFWMLAWAPGQALPAWISAGMFLASPKPVRPLCFGFLILCDLFWAPFAAVGLGMLAFFLVCREGFVKPVKSLAPLLALILPASMFVAFYAAKLSPEVTKHFPKIPIVWFTRFQDAAEPAQSVILLVMFVVFEFGILLALLRAALPKASEGRTLAEACGLSLLCLLPVTVGYYSDLAMRGCAVAWFGLAVLTARCVTNPQLSPRLRVWFWRVILVGALAPLIEMGDQGGKLLAGRYDPSVIPHGDSAVVNIAAGGFKFLGAQYVGSTNSFFWRELAR